MKLTVINKVLWKNVYLVLLDKDNNIIEKEKLSFDNNKKVITRNLLRSVRDGDGGDDGAFFCALIQR